MKKLFYILGLSMAVASCSTLDQAPSTQIPTGQIVTVSDLETAINGVYYRAGAGTQGTLASEVAIYADLKGSDVKQIGTSSQIASRVAKHQITPSDSYNFYYYPYVAIANINAALESVPNIDENEDGLETCVAELYALRGWLHFELARMFSPIPTSGNTNTNMGIVIADHVFGIDDYAPRATLDQTYQQIVDDLTKAIEMEDVYFMYDWYDGHMNHWAALGMRARAYLYWGKYAEALADCEEIINNSPFALYTIDNYTKVWSQTGADEMLFEMLQTDDYNAQRYAPGYYMNPNGYAECAMTDEFVAFLQEDENDVRGQMVANMSSSSGANTGYYPLKYPGNAGSSAPMYANNIKLMRLSEIYLIAAEAALKSGNGDPAAYINELRANRIEDYTDVASVTLEDILNERRKELFGENHMAFDGWRNGQTVKGVAPTDYQTVTPIPTDEINIAGGVLVQFPGWGR